MTPLQIETTQKIALAILESLSEAEDSGASGGVIYAALKAQGATLNQYQSLMTSLENNHLVVKKWGNFIITDKGISMIEKLKNKFKSN